MAKVIFYSPQLPERAISLGVVKYNAAGIELAAWRIEFSVIVR